MHGRSCKGDKLTKKEMQFVWIKGEGERVGGSKVELVEITKSEEACRDYTLMLCLF